MYRFDREKGILYSGQINIEPVFEGYQPSDHYTAWKKYLYTDPGGDTNIVCLQNDVRMLSNAVEVKVGKLPKGEKGNLFRLEVTDIRQHDSNSSSGNTEYCTVRGRAYISGAPTPEFNILQLPQITRAGTFYNDGLEYAIVCSAEPSKFITFDGRSTLSIATKAKKINVKSPFNKEATITLNSKDVALYDVISNLGIRLNDAYEEYMHTGDVELSCFREWDGVTYNDTIYNIPPKNLWNLIEQVETPDNVKYCYNGLNASGIGEALNKDIFGLYSKNSQKVNDLGKYPKPFYETFGMINGYSNNGVEPSNLGDIRYQLNELMSISRGLGRVLSRDVYDSSDNLLAREGDLVNKGMIAKFNSKRINCYYVKTSPVFQPGSELAIMIPIWEIPEGVYVPAMLRDQVPKRYMNEDGVTKCQVVYPDGETTGDLDFKICHLLLIKQGTIITRELLRFINSCFIYDTKEVIPTPSDLNAPQKLSEHNTIASNWNLKATRHRVPIVKNRYATAAESDDGEKQDDSTHYLLFEEEILGNRHFAANDGWVFVSEDGQEAPASPYLTVFDLVCLLSITYRLQNGQYIDLVADKDLGVRKKFCLIDDHIHEALVKGSRAYGSSAYGYIYKKKGDTITDKFAYKACSDIIEYMGGRGKKVTMLVDVTNPAAYVSSISRVNTVVADSHATTNTMRLLSMGYYGRICPYETPQSQKLGLTNSKAHRARIVNNEVWTPYYRVTHVGNRHKVDTSRKVWFTIQDEEKYRIADLLSLKLNENNVITNTGLVLARVPAVNSLEKMEVQNINIALIEYVNCYPDQTLSATATTIPYIGSNDAVRVSYGLSMARQSRPLMYREVPTIMTHANFDMVRMNDKFMVVAEADGEVVDVMTNDSRSKRNQQQLTITVAYNSKIEEKVGLESKLSHEPYNNMEVRYEYPLVEYNHQSVIIRKAEVVPGQFVKKGDILVSSNFTKDGFMTTTVNAFIGICPAGYNYEDGVLMSNGLRKKLTSFGHTEDEIKVSGNTRVEHRNYLNYHYTNVSRLVEWSVKLPNGSKYSSSDHIKGYLVRFVNDVKKQGHKGGKVRVSKTFKAHGISFNTLSGGDKIANRHGNKGVVPKVVDDEDMFYLANGQVLDILYNPVGMGSRMNIAQIKEAHITLALYVLGLKMCTQSFNEVSWKESTLLLEYAWDCANLGVDTTNADSKYSIYPESMRSYVKENELLVAMWKGIFEKDGTAYLYDPKTGKKKHGRVVIGINSIYKLIQESEDKLNARGGMIANSDYVAGSGRPVKGAKVNGGQTIGHMELQGLVAHGAKAFLKEMFHWRGDNVYERQTTVAKALGTYDELGPANVEIMETNKPRRATEEFFATLKALGLDVIVEEPEPYLPVNTRKVSDKRVIYPTRVIVGESKIPVNKETMEQAEEFASSSENVIDSYQFE